METAIPTRINLKRVFFIKAWTGRSESAGINRHRAGGESPPHRREAWTGRSVVKLFKKPCVQFVSVQSSPLKGKENVVAIIDPGLFEFSTGEITSKACRGLIGLSNSLFGNGAILEDHRECS